MVKLVRDLALSVHLLRSVQWRGFDPWPENILSCRSSQKKKGGGNGSLLPVRGNVEERARHPPPGHWPEASFLPEAPWDAVLCSAVALASLGVGPSSRSRQFLGSPCRPEGAL